MQPTQPPAPSRILLAVSGGISAYKSPAIVRRLKDRGCEVRVLLTPGAEAFVGELTFQAVSGERVHTTLLDAEAEAGMGHIELARWADSILIAPATANTIARLAAGLADDLLGTVVLASDVPLHLAPAMNQQMWSASATRDNLETLRDRGAVMHGPAAGDQACGDTGPGRMLEPEDLVNALLGQPLLTGRRVLITAGPTYEDIDPVRFIGNRSSGRMGFALAQAARQAGAEVTLVAGPVSLPAPPGINRVDVRSAEQMLEQVKAYLSGQDIFIATAAVADFRPAAQLPGKIKRGGRDGLQLDLVANRDILAQVAQQPDRPFCVGFAAETENLEDNAIRKLEDKRVDLIAANRVGEGLGFERSENALTVFSQSRSWELPMQPKPALAQALITIIAEQLDAD